MKYILDATCGGKMMWFEKENEHVVYLDKRDLGPGFMRTRKRFSVKPDIVADFRHLPFIDEVFSLVVFDPPHTIRKKESGGYIAERYGRLLESSWAEDLRLGFNECFRVLKPEGTLIVKWSECDVRFDELLALLPRAPLFGSRVGKDNRTLWAVISKPPRGNDGPQNDTRN